MSNIAGLLVGVHHNRFTGKPGRLLIQDGTLVIQERGKPDPIIYAGSLTIEKKRTEPFFANHWIQLDLPDGKVWLTCSRRRATAIAELANAQGLAVVWL